MLCRCRNRYRFGAGGKEAGRETPDNDKTGQLPCNSAPWIITQSLNVLTLI